MTMDNGLGERRAGGNTMHDGARMGLWDGWSWWC
jgi:hypothetical protein